MQPEFPKKPSSFDINPVEHNVPNGVTTPTKPVTAAAHQPTAFRQPQQYSHQSNQISGHQNTPNSSNPHSLNPKQRRRDEYKSIFYTILFFGTAIALPILMILFVFQSYVVDGSSMQPTLQNNNRVFILKLPKTIASVRNTTYLPTRNEIIVFKKPSNNKTQLIKRVIGLPGDKVVIENGVITVYNIDNPEGFNPDTGTDHENTLPPVDTGGLVITEDVGENELFVMGDNRGPNGSLDSHSGLGLVPVENIVGRLWLRYFPISEFTVFARSSVNDLLTSRIPAAMNTLR